MSMGLQHIIIELKSTKKKKNANLIPSLWNFMAKIPLKEIWVVGFFVGGFLGPTPFDPKCHLCFTHLISFPQKF